jgi:hypothetical protein
VADAPVFHPDVPAKAYQLKP